MIIEEIILLLDEVMRDGEFLEVPDSLEGSEMILKFSRDQGYKWVIKTYLINQVVQKKINEEELSKTLRNQVVLSKVSEAELSKTIAMCASTGGRESLASSILVMASKRHEIQAEQSISVEVEFLH